VTISRRRAVLVATLALLVATSAPADGWKRAEAGYEWSFPRDHWPHGGYRTEWWYFTGDLVSEEDPTRRFGYQFTIFKVGLVPGPVALDSGWAAADLVMGHAAITDLAKEAHRFAETLHRAAPILGGFRSFPDRPIATARAAPGSKGSWSLDWTGDGFEFSMEDDRAGIAIDLSTVPDKPLVLQGPGGLSRKGTGPSAASLYYSFPRLRTAGAITVFGERFRVRGTSWMDKEFGSSQLSEEQAGWDWFSLRLADGRDLMAYVLRRADGSADWRSATLVAADGTPRYLPDGGWTLHATARWRAVSGAEYPAAWTLEVPSAGLALTILPRIADQENRSRLSGGVDYYEGAVAVTDPSGREIGSGYVELTGYRRGSRPPV
jgi:predicted secreted hydrolase